MITPFRPDGSLDLDAAQKVATYLVDRGNDALVINGTTGEAPTTSDAGEGPAGQGGAGGGRRPGQGGRRRRHATTPRTRSSARSRPRPPARTGCWSSRRTTTSLRRTGCARTSPRSPTPPACRTCSYDIPGRAGVEIKTETLIALAEHPRIVAVKDAKGDVAGTTKVLANTDLFYYCGADELNLAWLAIGAVGIASVVAHVASDAVPAADRRRGGRRPRHRTARSTDGWCPPSRRS